jgi:hypothetical protein
LSRASQTFRKNAGDVKCFRGDEPLPIDAMENEVIDKARLADPHAHVSWSPCRAWFVRYSESPDRAAISFPPLALIARPILDARILTVHRRSTLSVT